ncbi:MFS transporter [Actinoplanes sp. ATCC 53533]|uniref:MFS transporter n=1 Tax=Actinoplanes sp. ATCC 53533 TaxID=1288362 RepID=UPI000F7970F3|nr:MFS transporter [Actinoplanes sp. ATCC 53533]RSM58085.1 MFS transporter [Actinoplanes sp. ATCC 53533]
MTIDSARVRRLAATLYAYAFLADLVLLYPVYALLFTDTGLPVWQISSLFVIWSAASTLLEVPSGAWADAVSRRLLLCLAPLVTAVAFALWVLVPSYPAFAVGFLLWGAGGALASGSLEALVHDELDHLGAAGRYARTMGRARTAGTAGVLAAIVLAGPVLATGGYPAVGAASVLACLLTAAVAFRFPEHREAATPPGSGPDQHGAAASLPGSGPDQHGAAASLPGPGPDQHAVAGPVRDEEPELGWWASLRGGLAEVRADGRVRAAVLLLAVVTAIWGALDEYTPLLAGDTGVARETVPVLLLLLWLGVTAGGLLAPLGERLTTRGYAALLACSGVALAAGALSARPAGFVLVAAGFCGFQLATVLADARLQARITGTSRATVTSLAGTATDLGTIAVYGGYALLATGAGNGAVFAVLAVPYLIVALALVVRRPGPAVPGEPHRAVAGKASPSASRMES